MSRTQSTQDQALPSLSFAWQTGGLIGRFEQDRASGRRRAMRPITRIAFVLTAMGTAWMASESRAQTPDEMAQTAAFAAAHQNPDGGFAADAVGQPSSVGATNSGLRVLRHVGGSMRDVLGCVNYVKSCRVPGGGFSPTPGGKPDVVTTAIGLLAASELKINDSDMIREAVAYLGKNARSFEEVRMAAAGLEAIGVTSPDAPRWLRQIEGMRNPDGTFGTGSSRAFASGGAAAAILRLGYPLEHRDAIVKVIKEAQRPRAAGPRTTGPPTSPAATGSCGPCSCCTSGPTSTACSPSSPGAASPTAAIPSPPRDPAASAGLISATIIIYWSRQLMGLPAVVETAGFTPLVNGDSLDGWDGDKSLWSAKDGVLIGRSHGLDHNEFLATTRPYGSFMLSLNFKLADGQGNSGVQFRSVRIPGHEMSGYQADIGEGYWGALYDESRRNMVLVYPRSEAVRGVHKSGWNRYAIRAMGDSITLSLNGQDSVRDYRETDPRIARDGLVAVQMHAGGSMEVQFRDMMIQPLPTPTAGEPHQPGFHLRTIETDQGERKYTVYIPDGYDGTKTFPVILFLHGAGERGDDGITPAQVGIGPAILNRHGRRPGHRRLPAGPADLVGHLARRHRRDPDARRGAPGLQGRPEARDPHRDLHGRHGELGHRRRPARAVRRRRAHLRGRRAVERRAAQELLGLDLLRRRRPRRDRAQPPHHGREAPQGGERRQAHRVSRRRPQ